MSQISLNTSIATKLYTGLMILIFILLFSLSPVKAVTDITIDQDPGILTINSTIAAGSQPQEVSDGSTSYTINTDQGTWQIVGNINQTMPANTILKINLPAPDSGTSQGDVVLTDIDQVLVTGIGKVTNITKTITYRFTATVEAGVLSTQSRTVTLTILTE